ncbi:MAG TPA: glycosyltransferase [Allosphingosinicella sp.]|nr:glycosyltransferase [Allosphingosinicella sp.]
MTDAASGPAPTPLERCNSLWIGPSLGPVERACLRSVLRQGHPLSLYCYDEPEGVPSGVELRDAAEVIPREEIIRHPNGGVSIFANRFRYELQRLGRGIWIDCDVYLLAPLLFPRPHLFGWQCDELIGNGVLRTPADSPLLPPLLALFDGDPPIPLWLSRSARLAAHLRRWRTGRNDVTLMPRATTGPHALTRTARETGLDGEALPRDALYPIRWQDADWIVDPSVRLEDRITGHTVAVHFWNECIREFKNAAAPAGSFLARLQEEGQEETGAPRAVDAATPSLSVVMPVHDGMPYVEESVASILAQSFTDFEFVIGDDGSSDGTGEALERWAARDDRIRLIRRERKSGLAGGANWVIAEARAPLIAIAHADDLSHPDRLGRQVETFRARPELDLVGTLWNGIDEEGREVRPADYWRLLRRSPFAPFSHSSAMFRRTAFERAGRYRSEAEYWEDLDLYFRIAEQGGVAVIPEALSTVRHARVSTRLRNDPARVEDAVDLMYRSTARYSAGGDHGDLLGPGRARAAGEKLHPMTFISCGSTRLWSGRSPAVLGRMWKRAGFGLDAASLKTLVWVLWGTASPRTLRLSLRTMMRLRNAVARRLLGDLDVIEWRPRERPPSGPGRQ